MAYSYERSRLELSMLEQNWITVVNQSKGFEFRIEVLEILERRL